MAEPELIDLKSSLITQCELESASNNLYVKLKDSQSALICSLIIKFHVPQSSYYLATPESKSFTSDNEKLLTSRTPSNRLSKKYEIIIEQHKLKNELLSNIKEDLTKQKKSLEEMLNEERNYSVNLESKVKNLSYEFSQSMKRAEDRDYTFLQRINSVISENKEIQLTNLSLESQLKDKENEIFYLKENLNRVSLFNYEGFLNEYSKKIDEISEMYYKSEKERDALQSTLKGSGEMTEKLIKSTNSSSALIESQNKSLIKDVKDLQDELKFYKLQQTELKLENSTLIDKLSTVDLKQLALQQSLDEKISALSQLSTENLQLRSEIFTIQSSKEKIEQEMNEFKCKTMQSANLERNRLDNIDLQLEKYFADQGLDNLFVKISTGLYVYGTQKVNVSIKGENLICRAGGGYFFIDEFIRQEGEVARGLSLASPLGNLKNSFLFPGRHNKNSSLVSYLVSPKQKTRPGLSLDLENQNSEKSFEGRIKINVQGNQKKLKK